MLENRTMKRGRKPVVTASLFALVAVLTFSATRSDASSAVSTRNVTVAAVGTTSLQNEIDSQEEQIQAMQEQLAFLKQAALQSESRGDEQAATLRELEGSVSLGNEPSEERKMEQWRIGYALGGGKHLAEFERTILPCESGGVPDPFEAVGRTDDWGRAQINRPTWSKRFTELTGRNFEEWILDPMLNGYMAGVVENEHPTGLSTWTCWRRR